jgi:hypothetical protein
MGIRRLCLLCVLIATSAFADDQVRAVQEELRKRNMYFGDVDGQMTEELVTSLKRYQARKGFTVTGAIDETTATSLNVQTTPAAAGKNSAWPAMPVLKSDSALAIEQEQRQRLAQQAEENPDAVPTPMPPAEEPPASQNLTRETVQNLVEQYLRDAETADVAAQTRYFAYPVDYLWHGLKGQEFVERDVEKYCKRWPERKYTLTEPVSFAAAGNEGETIVQFPIDFSVRNHRHAVTGKTRNTWTVRAEGDELKIVAIHEERLRE